MGQRVSLNSSNRDNSGPNSNDPPPNVVARFLPGVKASRPLWFDVAQHREDGTLC
jgi:hypothetical protein